MLRYRSKFIAIIVVLIFLSCKSRKDSAEQASVQKPNILLIHVDDLGYHDLSITGSEIYQTPNIDKLATESFQFQNAYANYPRCVPSRYAMMTGGYPIKDGDVPDDGFVMSNIPDSKNFVKQINNAGYQTAYFGKWHLGDGENNPHGFGYDTSIAAGAAGSPISYLYPFNTPKHKGINKKEPIEDLEETSEEGDYLTDVLTTQVKNYLKNRDTSKPFMAVLAFYAVHQPIEAKKEDEARNQKEIDAHDFGNQPEYIKEGTGRTKMRQDNAAYAGMVETMDKNVGELLQLLKDLNIDDHTIVIFSSDHGGLSNDGTKERQLATSNYPLRAGKGHLYEGGIKVPLFVKWTNKIKPSVDRESLVMHMDIFPTLVDIVSKKDLNTDGKSFMPILFQNNTWTNRTVFWHSSKARPANTGDTKSSAIRQGDYKLIHWYKEGRTELYDISKDPSESRDISKENEKLTKSLMESLKQWKSKHAIKDI